MAEQNDEQTYYELLDIPSNAGLEQIQRAYQEAKATYSPDSSAIYSMFSHEEAQQISELIDEAYYTLSDSQRRKSYDQSLSDAGFEVFIDKSQNAESKPEEKKRSIKSDNEEKIHQQNAEGMGFTRFSKYSLDEVFEKEIDEQQVFDGTFLKKIREYKNVSLGQLSEHLKIAKHHFTAIEDNDFQSLPATIFVKNYVKQYAEILKLDAKKVSESYVKILKEVREEE